MTLDLHGRSLRFIDLFAGIGGIRLGFERAFPNARTVFVSEWDANARQTYRANFPQPARMAADVTQAAVEDVPAFDVCLAGFPCQAFSQAGKRQGFDDNYYGRCRGTLFQHVIRICGHHRPAVIFCENVKGLTLHDHGRTFEIIKGAFEELGYQVFAKVLNSRDYGVPQNRERIYLVCFRQDIDARSFRFPAPTDDTMCLRDILERAPVPAKYYLSER